MRQIDYQLGLKGDSPSSCEAQGLCWVAIDPRHTRCVPCEQSSRASGEDWNNADGIGRAKAAFLACNAKCNLAHPFNKSKRLSCRGKCEAAYSAKISYIDSNISQDSSALDEAESILAEEVVETNQRSSEEETKKAGLGTGAMIGIGVGVLVLVVGGILIMRKK